MAFDNGAGKSPPGATQANGNPYPGFVDGFSSLPVPGTTAHTWYLGSNGTLNSAPPKRKTVNWYTSNAKALPLTDFGSNTGGGGLWGDASQWSWNWKQNPKGTAVSYVSSPLTANSTVIGAGAVHLWIKSSKPNVDLLATVSEVRPDGNETFVQNGYLRANERKLATTANNILKQPSTLLAPILTMRAKDVRAAVLRRTRVPGRLADPGDDLRSERNPARVVVLQGRAQGQGPRFDRVRHADAVQPDPARRARSQRPHRLPALPEPAQRAVPPLRGVQEPLSARSRLSA